MANSVQDVMLDAIVKASRAAEQITTAVDRNKAYVELAKACAMAIQTKGVTELPTSELPKETPKTAKRSRKTTTAEEKKEEPKIEQEPEVQQEEQSVQSSETVVEPVPEQKPQKDQPVQEQEKTPEQLEEEEYDFTTEWTPKACELMEKEIVEVQRYYNMFSNDVETFNSMVSAATEGVSTNIETITPLNIRIVLQYIKNLEAEGNGGE